MNSNASGLTLHGQRIIRFYLMDADNFDAPQEMRGNPDYFAKGTPHDTLNAEQFRVLANNLAFMAGRMGGYKERCEIWAELAGREELVEVTDPTRVLDDATQIGDFR